MNMDPSVAVLEQTEATLALSPPSSISSTGTSLELELESISSQSITTSMEVGAESISPRSSVTTPMELELESEPISPPSSITPPLLGSEAVCPPTNSVPVGSPPMQDASSDIQSGPCASPSLNLVKESELRPVSPLLLRRPPPMELMNPSVTTPMELEPESIFPIMIGIPLELEPEFIPPTIASTLELEPESVFPKTIVTPLDMDSESTLPTIATTLELESESVFSITIVTPLDLDMDSESIPSTSITTPMELESEAAVLLSTPAPVETTSAEAASLLPASSDLQSAPYAPLSLKLKKLVPVPESKTLLSPSHPIASTSRPFTNSALKQPKNGIRSVAQPEELSTLYRYPGGLTLLTLKNIKDIDISRFVNCMEARKCLLSGRIQQLMEKAGGEANLDKMKFIFLCVNEVMAVDTTLFKDAVTKRPFIFYDRFEFNFFGKTKRNRTDEMHGYAVYRILDSFVRPIGREEKLITDIIEEFNKTQIATNRPINEIFSEQRTTESAGGGDSTIKQRQLFSGEPFTLKCFSMYEETPKGALAQVLDEVGYEGWTTRTSSSIIFYYRPGEMFVCTRGIGHLVIKDYIDPRFPILIAMALLSLSISKKDLANSALFHNRESNYDMIISLSIMSQLLRGEKPSLASTVEIKKKKALEEQQS